MSPPDPSFEPAERDPKKLRNTALVLVAIMLAGGFLVLRAYENWSVGKAGDDRPAVIYRITPERDLRMIRQDGEQVDLKDLRGKVVAINVFSLKDPQAADRSMAVMKRLAQNRSAEADFALVSLLIDPIPSTELIPKLAQTALDREIALPKWWLGSNEPKTLHKFIKNELKADTYPNDRSGKWDYDASIVLIDKDGHIRRAVVPQKQGGPPFIATFNFNQAASWDDQGVKTGTELSNAAQLEALLNTTIDKLLAEPAKDS